MGRGRAALHQNPYLNPRTTGPLPTDVGVMRISNRIAIARMTGWGCSPRNAPEKPRHNPRPIHPHIPHTFITTRAKSPLPIRAAPRPRYPHAMDYAFATPLPGLSLLQRLLWPLIFVQLIALRHWVRAHYGRGVPYWITISKFGRVRLRHLPTDFANSQAAPVSYETFGHDYSAELTRALLATTCIAEETPATPMPEPTQAMPQTQSGQAPSQKGMAHPDTS